MTEFRAGVIGLGVGMQHLDTYAQLPDCRIVAVSDISEDKCREAKTKYPKIKVHSSAQALLEDPDINVVSIASFDDHHFSQVAKAIQNGKNIFVEKPLCLEEEEARTLRKMLKASPQLGFSSNLILRKHPVFQATKNRIEKGDFGKLYNLEADYLYGRLEKITRGWRGNIPNYSVMLGGGVHVVDLVLWLLNETAVEVMGFSNKICTESDSNPFDDFSVALIRFESGAIAKVSANFGCVLPHQHQLRVFGTKASLLPEQGEQLFFDSRDPAAKGLPIAPLLPHLDKGLLLSDFIDALRHKASLEVNQDEVFRTMSVCFAIEKSLREDGPVKVDYI